MRSFFHFFLIGVIFPPGLWAQTPALPATAFYSVFYLEVGPSARAPALSSIRQYRDASRKDEGYIRFEFFEQIGRPAHFVIIETWAAAKAFDAHRMAAHTTQFLDQLRPIRLSDYDQRPYKTLSVGSALPAPGGKMIDVITHVDIGGGQGDVPAMLSRVAEASRKEKGNMRFDVLQHTMRANHFTIIEAWQNQDALDAHAAAPHTRQYRDGLQPLIGSPLDERLYKAVE